MRQVPEGEVGHGAAEGHVALGKVDGGGEDPLGNGVVEGGAEEVAQQGHPAPRQLPSVRGAQDRAGGGEVTESVAEREEGFVGI